MKTLIVISLIGIGIVSLLYGMKYVFTIHATKFPTKDLKFRIREQKVNYLKQYRAEIYRKFWGWSPFSVLDNGNIKYESRFWNKKIFPESFIIKYKKSLGIE